MLLALWVSRSGLTTRYHLERLHTDATIAGELLTAAEHSPQREALTRFIETEVGREAILRTLLNFDSVQDAFQHDKLLIGAQDLEGMDRSLLRDRGVIWYAFRTGTQRTTTYRRSSLPVYGTYEVLPS